MKLTPLVAGILLGTCSVATAQSSGSGSVGATAGGSTGSTLSNGNTISGTGGGPGPNTSNALNHGTTGNNLGATPPMPNSSAPASTGNAVNTPAASQAQQNLGNTDTGVLKK